MHNGDGDVNIEASLPTLVVVGALFFLVLLLLGALPLPRLNCIFFALTFAIAAFAFVIVIVIIVVVGAIYSFMIYFCNRFQHMRQK